MSRYIEHMERELKAAQWDDDGMYGGLMRESLKQLLETFAEQGHSGMSAPIAVDYFSKLALFKPLAPLTGEEDEWNEIGEGKYQNKRCSHVFKDDDRFDGQAYDIHGKVFRQPNGACYTSAGSSVPIEFPYTPKTEYVDVEELA